MDDFTIKELEAEVLQQYDNGNYQPLGQDGGVLKYVLVYTKNGIARASITLDSEIAQIKRIWELSVDNKTVYDMTRQYYKLRV